MVRKLYVWTEFCSDYTGGLAIAIASSVEEAMKQIRENSEYEPQWGKLHVHSLDENIAYSVCGGG